MTLSLLAHYFSEKSKISYFLTLQRGDKKRDSNGRFVIKPLGVQVCFEWAWALEGCFSMCVYNPSQAWPGCLMYS